MSDGPSPAPGPSAGRGGTADADSPQHRQIGLTAAVLLGLTSMLGTGLFAVWTPALALAGDSLLVALALAAAVAALNAYSSASLAQRYPYGGGVYAYARRVLNRGWAVTAGVGFVVGKSASCAAAALTIGAYVWPEQQRLTAGLVLVVLLAINLGGITRTTSAGATMLLIVLAVVIPLALTGAFRDLGPVAEPTPGTVGRGSVLAAAGLLFVAFAGYARVGTLGQEVKDGSRNIPRAIAIVFVGAAALYAFVAVAVLNVSGHVELGPAPLTDVARAVGWGSGLVGLVAVASVIAAGGSALSLLAGMGRTVTAMADGKDAPARLARRCKTGVAGWAEVTAAAIAGILVAVGGIGQALAVSAITVLGYYSIAHVAWFRLSRNPLPLVGIIGCVALSVSLLLHG